MLSTIGMSSQFPLLQLPDELIALIIEQVDDLKTLRSLTRTCHRIQGIAESKLYRKLLIRSGDATRTLRRSLTSRPERVKVIRKVECPLKSTERQDYGALEHMLTVSTGLREFIFESPACNTDDFEDSDEWDHMVRHIFSPFQKAVPTIGQGVQQQPLQQLRDVTIHLNGENSPYWTLDVGTLALFLHPTIHKLHISCMNVLNELVEQIPDSMKGCTPLRNLMLEECNICSGGLGALLSLPKALESLYLGENCHNMRHFRNPVPKGSNLLFLYKPRATLEGLKQQKRSLKTLTYLTLSYFETAYIYFSPSCPDSGSIDGGFSEFLSLEKVTLVGYCPAFERCVMSMSSPPNLQHLAFKSEQPWLDHRIRPADGDIKPISVIPFLRAPSASLPKCLKQLDVTYQDIRAASISDFVRSRNRTSFFRGAHKAALDMGVTLRVFAIQTDGPLRYYPPFLWGEREPTETMLSDGSDLNST